MGTIKLHTAFADYSVTVEEVIADGDTVAARIIERGIHEGEFMGIAPTGQDFEIQGMMFARVKDEQSVERRVLVDIFGQMQQLGVIEAPGQ